MTVPRNRDVEDCCERRRPGFVVHVGSDNHVHNAMPVRLSIPDISSLGLFHYVPDIPLPSCEDPDPFASRNNDMSTWRTPVVEMLAGQDIDAGSQK